MVLAAVFCCAGLFGWIPSAFMLVGFVCRKPRLYYVFVAYMVILMRAVS